MDNESTIDVALNLAALMNKYPAAVEPARMLAEMLGDPESAGVFDHLVGAPEALRAALTPLYVRHLCERHGGTPEFWVEVVDHRAKQGLESRQSPVAPRTRADRVSPRVRRIEQHEQAFIESTAELRQQMRDLMSARRWRVKDLLEAVNSHVQPAFSLSALNMILGDRPRAMPRYVSFERRRDLAHALSMLRPQAAPPSQAPAREPAVAGRVRVNQPTMPTNHRERTLAAEAYLKSAGRATLADICRELSLDNPDTAYAVLRDVPGVRSAGNGEYVYSA